MTGMVRPSGQIGLTDREVQTVGLAAEGLKIEAIARRLSVSAGAVQSRLKFARLKTGSVRTTALVHQAYASGQLPMPNTEPPVPLTDDQVRVLGFLSTGMTLVDMESEVSWTQWRLRETYGDLLAALDAADRPAYAIKRAWAMGYLSAGQQNN
ncbi:hypothetical protein [Streptomyces sp. G-G2]|uniref:helix-turn-helix transcriptional regulator n=1 Tax=Streptomyces sp. G-G2 TaxID=3046201 RepID=UPI0024BBA59E|nr:hypothetical protein [Streptomyces sp. G-G2]MDJ0383163.1 hypothetical protein [Streptomyces sp. G-G2]